MPYKDPEKQRDFFKERYVAQIKYRIKTEESEFYDALIAASDTDSISPSEYARIATKEKLVRDGYIPEVE